MYGLVLETDRRNQSAAANLFPGCLLRRSSNADSYRCLVTDTMQNLERDLVRLVVKEPDGTAENRID